MAEAPVLVVVEGNTDQVVVASLLRRAGLPPDRFIVHPAGGSERVLSVARDFGHLGPMAVLVDLDDRSLPDAEAAARVRLGPEFRGEVYCAVPMLEAWLLADADALRRRLGDDPAMTAVLERLPLPEEIPNPRQFLRELFGTSVTRKEFLEALVDDMDVPRACAQSPSLRRFLEGLAALAGVEFTTALHGLARSVPRDVLSGLLGELPGDTVVWRSVTGESYTAAALREQIERGTETGRLYAADLLRISRDLLRRSAQKKSA